RQAARMAVAAESGFRTAPEAAREAALRESAGHRSRKRPRHPDSARRTCCNTPRFLRHKRTGHSSASVNLGRLSLPDISVESARILRHPLRPKDDRAEGPRAGYIVCPAYAGIDFRYLSIMAEVSLNHGAPWPGKRDCGLRSPRRRAD